MANMIAVQSPRAEYSFKPKKMHVVGPGFDRIVPFMLESTTISRLQTGEYDYRMIVALNRNTLEIQPRFVSGDNNIALVLRGNEALAKQQHLQTKAMQSQKERERDCSVYYALDDNTVVAKLSFRVDAAHQVVSPFLNLYVIADSADKFAQRTCNRMNMYPDYLSNISTYMLNQIRTRGIMAF